MKNGYRNDLWTLGRVAEIGDHGCVTAASTWATSLRKSHPWHTLSPGFTPLALTGRLVRRRMHASFPPMRSCAAVIALAVLTIWKHPDRRDVV